MRTVSQRQPSVSLKPLASLADGTFKMMVVAAHKDPSKWDNEIEQTYHAVSKKHAEAKAAFIESASEDLLQRRSSWLGAQLARLTRWTRTWRRKLSV